MLEISENIKMETETIRKYDLTILERILTRTYNVNFLSLNINGWEKFCDLWKNYNLDKLKHLIKNEVIFNDNNLNVELLNQLNDNEISNLLLGISSEKDKNDIHFYNKKVLSCIFKVIPDGVDPFYSELKDFYPIIKVLYRFHYLQLIYKISNSTNYTKSVRNPLGYSEFIVGTYTANYYKFSQYDGLILIISGIWQRPSSYNREINDGDFYCCHRVRLCIENDLHDLIEILTQFSNKELSFDQQQFLLSQCLGYPIIEKNIINYIIKKGTESYETFLRIFSDVELSKKFYNLLHNEEKVRLLASIPTFLSDECRSLIKYYLFRDERKRSIWKKILKRRKTDYEIVIYFPTAKAGNNVFKILVNLINDKIEFNKAKFSLERKKNIEHTEVFIDGKLNKSLGSKIYRLINKSHREDIAKMQSREKIMLSIFRHEFEKTQLENKNSYINPHQTLPQICITLRHAKRMVIADYALYLEYDGINLELNCVDAIRNEFLLELNDEEILKKQEWENLIIEELKGLKVYEKNHYKCCQCIKTENVISKFILNKDDIKFSSLLANQIDQNYSIGELSEGLNEKDHIILPIIAHNRKLGVLYLASSKQEHFKYFDRVRLVNFVQEIGVEIFEAKMLETFRNLNALLGKVLENKINEEQFMDGLAEKVVNLLGCEGALILWKQAEDTTHYHIAGRAGKLKSYFKIREYLPGDGEIWGTAPNEKEIQSHILEDKGVIEKRLKSDNYNSCIHIPMATYRFNGFITIFDFKKNSFVTSSLQQELRILGVELERIMLRYFVNQSVMQNIKSTIGHDLSSILRSTYGACEHLAEVKIENSIQKVNQNKRIADIHGYMDYGNDLLDFFLKNLNDKEIIETFEKGKNIPAYADMLIEKIKENPNLLIENYIENGDRDVYNIILSVIQTKKMFNRLKKVNTFQHNLDRQLRNIPALWLHKDALRQIVNNLLDNYEKYNINQSPLLIKSFETYNGWNIIFENKGKCLDSFHSANPSELFGFGVHISDEKDKGNGMGLFISRELLKAFGGDITLEYKEIDKREAKFSFSLFFPFWLEIYDELNNITPFPHVKL